MAPILQKLDHQGPPALDVDADQAEMDVFAWAIPQAVGAGL
jgi:hypothetical protein